MLKISESFFFCKNFHFLVVKFSVYLNRHVFVTRSRKQGFVFYINHYLRKIIRTEEILKIYRTDSIFLLIVPRQSLCLRSSFFLRWKFHYVGFVLLLFVPPSRKQAHVMLNPLNSTFI